MTKKIKGQDWVNVAIVRLCAFRKKYFTTDSLKTFILISSFILSIVNLYYNIFKPDRAIMSIIIEDINGSYTNNVRLELEIFGSISNEGSRVALIRSIDFIFLLNNSKINMDIDKLSLTTYEGITTKYLRSKESIFFNMVVHNSNIELKSTFYKAVITILYDDGIGPNTKQRSYSEKIELEINRTIDSYGTIIYKPA